MGGFYEFGFHVGEVLAVVAVSGVLYAVLLMVVPSVRRWALSPVTRRRASRRCRANLD